MQTKIVLPELYEVFRYRNGENINMTEGIIDKVFAKYLTNFNNCKCEFCKLIPYEIIVLQQELKAEILILHESVLDISEEYTDGHMRLIRGLLGNSEKQELKAEILILHESVLDISEEYTDGHMRLIRGLLGNSEKQE